MRTALDALPETLSASEKAFVTMIRENGFFRTEVLGDDEGPGFSFTTGFWVTAKHPELIMFSMTGDIAHDIFWDLFKDARSARSLPVGRRTDQVFANLPAYAFPVAKRHYADHLGWSRWFYGDDKFPCIQIVWPDRGGVFPWEKGFDATFVNDQPDLSEHGWVKSLAV
ncbi:DUF4262 domain-containing protein [Sphingomonas sanxanigenens]|nr:DUF4262 domain-containing protein [Sphingomonas sanxanigenens]